MTFNIDVYFQYYCIEAHFQNHVNFIHNDKSHLQHSASHNFELTYLINKYTIPSQ